MVAPESAKGAGALKRGRAPEGGSSMGCSVENDIPNEVIRAHMADNKGEAFGRIKKKRGFPERGDSKILALGIM